MLKQDRIYIAGSRTVIGSAIQRALEYQGYTNLVAAPEEEPDLTNASVVFRTTRRGGIPRGEHISRHD